MPSIKVAAVVGLFSKVRGLGLRVWSYCGCVNGCMGSGWADGGGSTGKEVATAAKPVMLVLDWNFSKPVRVG